MAMTAWSPWSQRLFLANQYEILSNHPRGAPLRTGHPRSPQSTAIEGRSSKDKAAAFYEFVRWSF